MYNKSVHKRIFNYTWNMFDKDVDKLIKEIKLIEIKITAIMAIPKGGLCLGVVLANRLKLPLFTTIREAILNKHKLKEILIVDDVVDTGSTIIKNNLQGKGLLILSLFIKPHTKYFPFYWCRKVSNETWIKYPWE